MSTLHRLSLVALSALAPIAAIGCGGSDAPNATTTTTAGARTPGGDSGAPAVESTTATANPAGAIAINVSYDDAESLYRAGQYREATELFDAYVAGHQENPWGHYMLGLSAWKAGDRELAEQAFDRALALDPRHVKSMLNSARVLLELDRPTEALERVEGALAVDSTSSDALRMLGRVRHELGRVDGAVQAYRLAILQDERDVWAMNNLGLVYLEQGRADLALPPLARAVELRRTAPVFQNNLGIALERSGHLPAAAKAYEAALAADSSYEKAAVSLARVSALVDSTAADSAAGAIGADGVDLRELAQEFRETVRLWRETMQAPAMARDSAAELEQDSAETADSAGTPEATPEAVPEVTPEPQQ